MENRNGRERRKREKGRRIEKRDNHVLKKTHVPPTD
jgi:hypothetical protein